MLPIYAISITAYVIFDYGFTELAMKIKLFHIDSKLAKHVKVNWEENILKHLRIYFPFIKEWTQKSKNINKKIYDPLKQLS